MTALIPVLASTTVLLHTLAENDALSGALRGALIGGGIGAGVGILAYLLKKKK